MTTVSFGQHDTHSRLLHRTIGTEPPELIGAMFTEDLAELAVDALNAYVAAPAEQELVRDVLAKRIEKWATDEDWKVYHYVDTLLSDLDQAGFAVYASDAASIVDSEGSEP